MWVGRSEVCSDVFIAPCFSSASFSLNVLTVNLRTLFPPASQLVIEKTAFGAKAYTGGYAEVPTWDDILDILDLWRWRELRGQGWPAYRARLLDILAPCHWWLRIYTFKDMRLDVMAGVTVCLILIPQGMGYAKNAGMLPVAGLYSACTQRTGRRWGACPRS